MPTEPRYGGGLSLRPKGWGVHPFLPTTEDPSSPRPIRWDRSPLRNTPGSAVEAGLVSQHRYRLHPKTTVRELAEVWLNAVSAQVVQRQRSRQTIKNYRNDTPLLIDLAEVQVRALTSDDVVGWHEALSAVLASARAYRAYVTLRVLLSYARRRGLVTNNVAACLGITHRPQPARPLLPDDLEPWDAAFAAAWTRRRAYIDTRKDASAFERVALLSSLVALELIKRTGRRIGEVCGILVANVHLRSCCILLPETKTGQSSIPLGSEAREFVAEQLERLAGRSPYLLPSLRPDRPITTRTVWEHCRRIAAEAGIPCHPHDFRHGWIYTALAAGVSLDDTSRGAGHRDKATTARIYAPGVAITPGMVLASEAVERARREVGWWDSQVLVPRKDGAS